MLSWAGNATWRGEGTSVLNMGDSTCRVQLWRIVAIQTWSADLLMCQLEGGIQVGGVCCSSRLGGGGKPATFCRQGRRRRLCSRRFDHLRGKQRRR